MHFACANLQPLGTLSLCPPLPAAMTQADFKRQLSKARQLLVTKKFSPALLLYERLVKQMPADPVLWFEYGNAASGLRDFPVADRAWRQALALARNAELSGLIGHQYQGLRQPERARVCFAQAAAADPRAINPRISLAVLAEQNHRLAEARVAVEECLGIDPRDDQARYFQAVLERRENKLTEAETRLRDLLSSEPRHPYVRYACRYELAQVLDRTERFDEAMRFLGEAKAIVRALTNTELLLRGYDQGAQSAR